MPSQRKLLVIADDFGIGPNTSRAILELAQRKVVTGSVLLVNSPYAEEGVQKWRQAGRPMELGWHPNLTLDMPILPAKRVPSLTRPDGTFGRWGGSCVACGRDRSTPTKSRRSFGPSCSVFRHSSGSSPPTSIRTST